ncbi:zinc-binding dehydrogenase [Streptomyces microflavus]
MRFGAAVLRSYEEPFAVEEVMLSSGPADGEILVRIAGCGMCRTDLAVRRSAGRSPLPAVLGHEGAGVVVETGGPDTGLSPGDHVVLSFDSCGHCRSCLGAAPPTATGSPRSTSSGAYRERGAVHRRGRGRARPPVVRPVLFRRVRDGPGPQRRAGRRLAPPRTARTARLRVPDRRRGGVQLLRRRPGDAVAVCGAGAVGLAAVMAATAAGAFTVAVDRHPERLAQAEKFGAVPLDAASADLPGRIQRLTDGGARYALDTTGSGGLINDALRALRPTGHLGLVARLHTALPLEPGTLNRGRRISHICEGDAVPGLLIPRLTGLWQAGLFPFDQLIRTYPLADIDEAERDCEAGRVVKPVLIPEHRT